MHLNDVRRYIMFIFVLDNINFFPDSSHYDTNTYTV